MTSLKLDFLQFVMTSQGERKMAEGTDNVEDRLSCNDSSYSERNLEVYDSGDSVNSGSEDEEYGGGDTNALVKEPYSFA